jgi:NADPH:quinone reductase-like Zn-dependent oxidoreductase
MPPGFALPDRLALGLSRPRRAVFGTELAGEIEAGGESVTTFHVGERVFAFPGVALGAHADYRCMPEAGCVARIPSGMGYIEAAALSFGGTTALDFLRRGKARPGEKLLVRGASGAVGSAAIQLGRHFGLDVTALCSSDNADWVAKLGAN